MTDFKRVEHLFANFFASTQLLAPSEQREVQDFIDHGEYGLALDTLVAIVVEEGKAPTDVLCSTVTALSECMSRDPKPVLDRLQTESSIQGSK